MSQILDYKCPNCSSPLLFQPGTQSLKCSSCGTEMDAAAFTALDEALKTGDAAADYGTYRGAALDEVNQQHCNSCGGELITDGTAIVTECPYCGNTAIITQRVKGALKPDYVIPFKIEGDAAKSTLRDFYKKKPLLPKHFKTDSQIDKLTGVYVPFWLYDCDTDSQGVYDATRTRSWTSGNTRYTETSHYLATRRGELSFDKLPVDASEKMDDAAMEAIEPYNYQDMAPFSTAYLTGHLADRQDVDFAKCKPRIDERVNKSVDDSLRGTVRGYNSVRRRSLNVRVTKHNISYAMLPVWLLNTKWKNKNYPFTMNGQTGKMTGRLPVDKKKAFFIFLPIFALLAALSIALTLVFDDGSFSLPLVLGICIAVSAAIPAIVIAVMAAKMKTKPSRRLSKVYERNFRLTRQSDVFLYKTVSRQQIQSSSSPTRRR
ncbi:MAG: hypothetical protein FWE84_02765 [Firmicutes bacterium]|nr:hypothetical protein [Bacillota bacterium]